MTTPDNSSDADRKAQRITPERQPVFPCELWDSSCEHWTPRKSIADGFTRLDLHNDRLTHWRPFKPDAPQEVPDDAPGKSRAELDAGFKTWREELKSDPTPAPSKETIANEVALEALQHLKTLAIPSKDDCQLTTEYWSALEQLKTKYIAPIILRALDRAGEAKGADGDRLLRLTEIHREALGREVRKVWIEWAKTQPNPKPSWLVEWDGLSEPDREVDRMIGERLCKVGVESTFSANPPASVDAGTRKEETPRTEAAVEVWKLAKNDPWTRVYLARTLERELNEANGIAKGEFNRATYFEKELLALTAQRDSLAEQLEEANLRCMSNSDEAAGLAMQLAEAKEELGQQSDWMKIAQRRADALAEKEKVNTRMCRRVNGGEDTSEDCPFCLAKMQTPGVPNPMCHLCDLESNRSSLLARLATIEADKHSGAGLIEAERKRQVTEEEWTEFHDDTHKSGDLRDAAEAYLRELRYRPSRDGPRCGPSAPWPWSQDAWKPTADPVRQLTKAGALIAAEIDRLQRSANPWLLSEGGEGK